VILNVSMPKLNGFEAAREINKYVPESAIVILSTHADKHFIEEAKKIGVGVYISKTKAGAALVGRCRGCRTWPGFCCYGVAFAHLSPTLLIRSHHGIPADADVPPTEPFDHPDWLFELKYDGFRACAIIEHGKTQLISRNGHTFNRYSDLCNENHAAVRRQDRDRR
jgi:hypothetical protein